jgi:outer membrane lipoprotein-sorting protein
MTNFEDPIIVDRLKRLGRLGPGKESVTRALEHARATLANLSEAPAVRPREDANIGNHLSQFLAGLTPRQRIVAFGGAGAAALLGCILLWAGIGARNVSAMEQMAENIRKATSYKYTEIVRLADPGREPTVTEFTVCWRAPESGRVEIMRRDDSSQGPQVVEIEPGAKPRICIFPRTKTYRIYPPLKSSPYTQGVDKIQDLGRCSGQADRQLGTRQINGKLARGFEIDLEKVKRIINDSPAPKQSAPDGSRSKGTAEIWLDPDSNLPVLVRYTGGFKTYFGGSSETEFKDIQWNIDLDPNLFDATPPEGYKDITPHLTVDEQVGRITEFLKIWAEVSGGKYPRAAGNPMWQDFADLFHVAQWRTDPGVKKQYAAKCVAANKGFLVLDDIRQYNFDFAYHGTTGPNDKDKLLLRWQLDDGRYEVIFGDLRAETVTADRLRALEGKQ